jgi:drug efflux transport system permease protein
MALSGRRIREMLRKELRQMFRDPRMKPIVFVSPVIQLLLFGYAVNTDISHTATFVVDQDHTEDSRSLLEAFTSTDYFHVVGSSDRPADLVSALDHGDAVVGIAIPVDFSKDMRRGEGAVQILVDGSNSNTGTVAQGYAIRIVQQFVARRAQASGINPQIIDVRSRAWYNPELESRVYNVPAIIGVLILLMCLLLTSLGVVRERETGTLDQLLVSPLKPIELMLGKTLPVALVALIDLFLISTVAILWFDIPLRGSPLTLLMASMIFIVTGLAFGLVISTVSKTQQEAFMTMFFFLLPSIILSGFFYPIASMPVGFQVLTLGNPMRHYLEIVRGVFLKGIGLRELWPQHLVLLVTAAAALWFATIRFKKSVS